MNSEECARFLRGCGVRQPPVLVASQIAHRGTFLPPRRFRLAAPFAVVGSDPRVDVVLDDPHVSPRHALVLWFGTRALCIDLGGQTGLVRADGPARAGWLEPGRGVRLGNHLLTLASEATPATPLLDGRESSDNARHLLSGPIPRLTIDIENARERHSWKMRRLLVLLGHSPGCRLRLRDPAIAAYHAALVRSANGLWVIDLLPHVASAQFAPLDLGATHHRCRPLPHGSVLHLGGFSLRPRYHNQTLNEPVTHRAFSQRRVLPQASAEELAEVVERQGEEIDALRLELDRLRLELESLRLRSRSRPRLKRRSPEANARASCDNALPGRTLGRATRAARRPEEASDEREPA